ncbi:MULTISPECIES: hypothetical protein [Mycobacteriaceae]|uniref:hypothetical protein n=1 Tax=Mycobacteriaceae TaxID=1762 RepID=UPI00080240FC|nr:MULTISPECIES: hypothetical protein [Mycobacteriaceae]MCK0172950.1 hypothetical protein [Mycolicibacterium sp. F2034L]OBB57880.1 hypothetical protein A5757_18825 [Mycobacterium sp. 852013-51886_SCH5428379]
MTEQPPGPPGNYPPPPPGGYPPPPPPGGYPPPPAGGYPPPPPPGGYPPPPTGYYPPPQSFGGGYPPPGAGYPQMGGPGGQFSIGDGLSWAWNKFSKNALALIVATLAVGAVLAVLVGVIYAVAIGVSPEATSVYENYDGGASYDFYAELSGAGILVMLVGYLVLLVVSGALLAGYYRGLLDIADGQRVSIGSFFKPRNVGSVVIASFLTGIITGIGYALCYVPGLIASIFLLFTTVAVVDRGLSPVEAIKQSFTVAKAQFVPVLLTWLLAMIAIFVGSFLCGIGLLVGAPVAGLLVVSSYRRLTGGPLAPATP